MKMWKVTAAAVLAGLFAGGGASAADSLDGDLNCLMVSFLIAGDAKPELAQAGQMQAIYYAGKLDGRLSETAIEQRIAALAPTITDAWIRENAARCGGLLMAKGQELVRIGDRLQATAATAK